LKKLPQLKLFQTF